MAKIFYSLAGEGRGHATRVRAIVEPLRHEHQVVLFAAGEAHHLLRDTYRGTNVTVHRIPGLRFQYRDNAIAYGRTGQAALRYLRQLPRLLRFMSELLRRAKPDLVIADFEPALPRAARRCGIPFLSVDHQHLLTCCDLASLPWSLRWRARFLGAVVGAFYSGQRETVVSSFYFPPLKSGQKDVRQIGVLLRPEILAARPDDGGHLLTYLRRDVPPNVLETLQSCGRAVKVYGLGDRPRDRHLTFHAIQERGFIDDLAGAHAVVCTAGNQLVGEALYLGKPVLALPELRNFEQYINAHFLRQSGAGDWAEMRAFAPACLERFLGGLAEFRRHIDPVKVNGNPQAQAIINRHLAGKTTAQQPVFAEVNA